MRENVASRELSPRERQIAEAYARGADHRTIAEQFFIAPATVRTHVAAIYRKLDVGSKVALGDALRIGASAEPRESRAPVLFLAAFESQSPRERLMASCLGTEIGARIGGNAGLDITIDAAGASHRLEGGVILAEGGARVYARLIDARAGRQLWAERLDADETDLFSTIDRCAAWIAERIETELAPAEDEEAPPRRAGRRC